MRKLYITVEAYDQFAQDVSVGFDRQKAITDAQRMAALGGWSMDSEGVRDVEATPEHSALIYHVQKEAERCEDYISVFEVEIPAPEAGVEFRIHTPKNMFESIPDTFGVDPESLTLEQIEAELKIHRETLGSGKASATGNIHVRIGDLTRTAFSKLRVKANKIVDT